jgi:hypothetical protein
MSQLSEPYSNTKTSSPLNTFEAWRFSFNGQAKDDEIYGEGNTYSAQFWEYDARLGRRWNLDPKPQISISDYACFANNPILFSDPLGDIIKYGTWNPIEFIKRYRGIRQRADWKDNPDGRPGIKSTYGGLFNKKELNLLGVNDAYTNVKFSWGTLNTAPVTLVQGDPSHGDNGFLTYDLKPFFGYLKATTPQELTSKIETSNSLNVTPKSIPFSSAVNSISARFNDNLAMFRNTIEAKNQIESIAKTFKESGSSSINIQVFTAQNAPILARQRANLVRNMLIGSGVPPASFQGNNWFTPSIGTPGVIINVQ